MLRSRKLIRKVTYLSYVSIRAIDRFVWTGCVGGEDVDGSK